MRHSASSMRSLFLLSAASLLLLTLVSVRGESAAQPAAVPVPAASESFESVLAATQAAADQASQWVMSLYSGLLARTGAHLQPQRAHPPHELLEFVPASKLWSLLEPRPSPVSANWWVALASCLVFMALYGLSSAVHSYATDDLARGLTMHAAEANMQRADHQREHQQAKASLIYEQKDATEAEEESSTGNGIHHRTTTAAATARVAPAHVQVIPAVQIPRASARRSLLGTYWYAYASAAQRSLTARIDWNSRLVSNIHALVSCGLGVLCFLSSSSTVDSDVIEAAGVVLPSSSSSSSVVPIRRSGAELLNPFSASFTPSLAAFNEDPLRDVALMITCGYLIYDLILCLSVRIKFAGVKDPFRRPAAAAAAAAAVADSSTTAVDAEPSIKIDDGLTLLHHVLIITAFGLGVHMHIGTAIMSCFLLNEASTFALNTNFVLASMRASGLWGAEDHKRGAWFGQLYKINGVVLFVLFLFMRVVFNTLVVGTMLYTWVSLSDLWVSVDADSAPFILQGPASMPTTTFIQASALTILAIGHVCINLVWFRALAKAIKRKLA